MTTDWYYAQLWKSEICFGVAIREKHESTLQIMFGTS